jgi:hypothetical protein
MFEVIALLAVGQLVQDPDAGRTTRGVIAEPVEQTPRRSPLGR